MTVALLLASHAADHWLVNVALFGGPVLALALLLWVWHRRDRLGAEAGDEADTPDRTS